MQMKRLTDHPTQGGQLLVLRPGHRGEPTPDERPPSFMQQQHLDLRRAMESRELHDASWLCISFSITGPLDREALVAAVRDWALRHEVMRGWFVDAPDRETGYARHAVAGDDLDLALVPHGEAVEPTDTHTAVDRLLTATCTPFDDLGWALLAVEQPERTVVYVGMDHVYSDGFSALVAFYELTAGYEARRSTGEAVEMPPTTSFVDHAATERATFAEVSRRHPAVRSWLGYGLKGKGSLGSFPMPLGLAPGEKAWLVPGHHVLLAGEEAARLERLAKDEGVGLAALVYAAFALAARDLAGARAYRFLNPVITRDTPELMLASGWLVNLIPIHVKVRRDDDLLGTALRVRQVFADAKVAAQVPVVRVVQLLGSTLGLDLQGDRRPPIVSYLDGRKIPGNETWVERDFYGLTGSGYDDDVNVWVNRTDEDLHVTCSVPDTPEAVANVARFFSHAGGLLRALVT